jgi:quercetin dioxygenase-like cupin family protein
MSLLSTPLSAGSLNGVVYTFEQVGDVLPMHTHDEMTAHLTIVARGRVKHMAMVGQQSTVQDR